MTDDPKSERRDALPPPARPKHASIADIVEQVVTEKLTERLEEVVASKFDSLLPINEEQLEILRESREERERRKTEDADRKKQEQAQALAQKRADRWQAILATVLGIILTGLEIYRATKH